MSTATPPLADFPEFEASGPAAAPSGDGATDLVREHFEPLYRFALAVLEAPEPARTAAVYSLAAAQRDRATFAGGGRLWLFSQAVKHIERQEHPRPSEPPATPPALGFEAALRQVVDRWDAKERQMAVLYYILNWPLAETAALLKVNLAAVQAQLEIFRRQFAGLTDSDAPVSSADTPATVRIPLAGRPALTPAEQRAAAFLSQRWPARELSAAEIETISDEVARLAAGLRSPAGGRRAPSIPLAARLAALLAGALALVCLLGAGGIWLLGQRGVGPLAPPTATVVIPGLPTPFPPTPQVAPLSRRSTSADIRRRWQEHTAQWNTLTVDAQIVDYGPVGYIGPARSYRAQAWVLLPDVGIELFGLLSQPEGQVYLVGGGRAITRSYVEDRTSSATWSGETQDLVANPLLRSMLFPSSARWALPAGSFWWAETTEALGRTAIVFDWLNQLNQREARLWLDAETGIILRAKVYAAPEFQRLLREGALTEVAFQRREPPPALIVAAQQSQAVDVATPGFQTLPATPTPAFDTTSPAPIPSDPAPPGMDPSRSRLIFQFADDPALANRLLDTASAPAELFADGYSLGEVRFGLPWALRCHRSADGRRIAFNTGSDGASAPDDSLHWFNLNAPGEVYQPMPGFHAAEFAFAPDGMSLAAIGEGGQSLPSGIYEVDIATGEHRRVLEVAGGRSLAWSPDGEFLALIGRLPGEELSAILVVHVDTGQLAYQGEPGAVQALAAGAPLAAWGIPFPVEMGGLEACTEPRP